MGVQGVKPVTRASASTSAEVAGTSPGCMGRKRFSAVRPSASSSRAITSNRSRSEEHTSELQSRFDLVCRLLLEKKNNLRITTTILTDLDQLSSREQPNDMPV